MAARGNLSPRPLCPRFLSRAWRTSSDVQGPRRSSSSTPVPLAHGLPLFSEFAVPRPLKLISSKVFRGRGGADLSTGVKRVALDHFVDIRAIQCCKVENYLQRAKARPDSNLRARCPILPENASTRESLQAARVVAVQWDPTASRECGALVTQAKRGQETRLAWLSRAPYQGVLPRGTYWGNSADLFH
jgi:hypothetical protein